MFFFLVDSRLFNLPLSRELFDSKEFNEYKNFSLFLKYSISYLKHLNLFLCWTNLILGSSLSAFKSISLIRLFNQPHSSSGKIYFLFLSKISNCSILLLEFEFDSFT